MVNGTQQVAPMSRKINSPGECLVTGTGSAAEGLVIAFDGVSIASQDKTAPTTCSLAFSGTIDVTNQNGVAGIQCPKSDNSECPGNVYTIQGWQDVLRIIFADNSTSSGGALNKSTDCNSDLRHSLVNNWGKLKPQEQKDFVQLLRDLIQANYVNVQQGNVNYTVDYAGEAPNKDGTILDNTVIKAQRKGRPFSMKIDYVMIKKGTSFQCFDVVTDGVSLVDNYKSTFDKLMKDKGFAGLMTTMKNKLAQIQASPGAGSAAPPAAGSAAPKTGAPSKT
jgi:hypothetical protein